MSDDEILAELERRIKQWFQDDGWAEENCGLHLVERTIEQLRSGGAAPEWD